MCLPSSFLKARTQTHARENTMKKTFITTPVDRRTIIKAGAALSASTLYTPSILSYALGETPIKIGMHDPLTGTYAAEGDSEVRGAKMALADINAKKGILGRQ